MRKTLFVGFDGVMHGTFQAELAPFCKLPLLEEVLLNQPVDIVVSSSRQHLYSLSEIKAMFGNLSGQVVSCTDGQLFGKYTRYREIMNYVKAMRILDWRALDDAANQFPKDEPHLIPCNPKTGIGPTQVKQLVAWLHL